jgi:hypothetical protein
MANHRPIHPIASLLTPLVTALLLIGITTTAAAEERRSFQEAIPKVCLNEPLLIIDGEVIMNLFAREMNRHFDLGNAELAVPMATGYCGSLDEGVNAAAVVVVTSGTPMRITYHVYGLFGEDFAVALEARFGSHSDQALRDRGEAYLHGSLPHWWFSMNPDHQSIDRALQEATASATNAWRNVLGFLLEDRY